VGWVKGDERRGQRRRQRRKRRSETSEEGLPAVSGTLTAALTLAVTLSSYFRGDVMVVLLCRDGGVGCYECQGCGDLCAGAVVVAGL